jgi:hypothetical protein
MRLATILLLVTLSIACSSGKAPLGDVLTDTVTTDLSLDGTDGSLLDGLVADVSPLPDLPGLEDSSGFDVPPLEETVPDVCAPDCGDRVCGDDGCGGTCGTCGELLVCDDGGACQPTPCNSSKDCPGDLICHKELSICVECAVDADCLDGKLCNPFFQCYEPVLCDSDKDCKAFDMVCLKEAGYCVECLDHPDCADDHFCLDLFCLPDICPADAVGCDGNAVATCNPVGNGYLDPVACLETQYCDAGICHDQICPPAMAYCDGSVRKECDELGKTLLVEEDCAGLELVCVAGECLDLVCAPLEDFCADDATLAHCNEDGMEFAADPCAEGTYCLAGGCVPWACTPGESVCADATLLSTCNAFGSGPLPEAIDCADDGLCCYAGACGAPMDELCDGKDNNCNGDTDEGCNDDGDSFCDAEMLVLGKPTICLDGPGDCDDTNDAIYPGATEVAGDGIDNDCDGATDEVEACPGPCTGNTVEAYLCALEMCLAPQVISAQFHSPSGDTIDTAWAAVEHFGNADNDLSPWAGSSYGLLASGPATGSSHSTDLKGGNGVPDPFANDGYTTHDNVEFTVQLQAPQAALGFSIDYIFMSVEYEEYIGSSFNDKFYIILNGPTTTGGQAEVINLTACSNPANYYDIIDPVTGEKLCFMAINTAFSEPCSAVTTSIAGTGFECGPADSAHGSSTGWLSTAWPVASGEIVELTFHIHDTSDGIFDSEVILDNFQWLYVPFVPGTSVKTLSEP